MIARAAVEDDCAGVVACALTFQPYTPDQLSVEALFDDAMACGGMFVAEHDERIVGFLCAVKLPHPFTGRDYITVVAWWVIPEWRATGAGLGLLRIFARWLSTQRVDMVTICAPLGSQLGSVLHKHGFVPVEVVWMKGVAWGP
jgi:hypothetical protein